MDGVYVVEMKHEEVEKLLLEEMKKCSSSDIPMYLRRLELIRKFKDEDGIAIRLDSLLATKSNEIRSVVREQVINKRKEKEEELGRMKRKAISDVHVDFSEAEVTSNLIELYEGIAERDKIYIMIK